MVPNLCQMNFSNFCSSSGIQHNFIAPYHPHSNGEAEQLVETFKRNIGKVNPKSASQLQDAVIHFLAMHWSTPQQLTIWTIEQQTITNSFQAVWARNFHQGPRWHRGTVTECLGNVMLKVQLKDQCDVIRRRHANQLRTRITPVNVDFANNADSYDARSVSNNPLPLRRSSWVCKLIHRWVLNPKYQERRCGIWPN